MPLRLFRFAALAEACSWIGLLVGMFFKYVVVHNEIGVKVFGPIHGALFVLYGVSVLLCARNYRWDARTVLLGLFASIPPLATLWFERRVAQRDVLAG